MQFNAQTKQAQAQIAALNAEMKALQTQSMMMNKMSSSVLSRGTKGPTMMDFNLRGPLGQMDELTKRIQKGKISQKEFLETVRGTNKMYEYQNALQKASLANITKMGSQRFRTGINLPELQAQSSWLRRNAVEWATAGAAAKAYGRQVMDTGKNMAFMGRQAMLSITAPLALIAGGSAAVFYQVDKQLTNLAKVYGDVGASGQASLGDLREAARGLAAELNQHYGTAQKDTFDLASAFAALGESGKNLDYMTSAAARLMLLGDVSVDSATKMISTLRTVFDLEGEKLQDAINTVNTFENSSTLTAQDFSDALPKMGSIVKSWGGDVKEAGILLESFTKGGIDAVEGANTLKSGFASLVNPTKVLEQTFSDMTGGMSLSKITKDMNGDVTKILAEIGRIQKVQNWSESDQKKFAATLWGKYQLNKGMTLTKGLANPTEQMAKIMAMDKKQFEDYNKSVANREVAVQMQSASNQFKKTINEIQMYAEKFGEKVLPKITSAIRGIIDLVKLVYNGATGIIDRLGPIGDILVKIGQAAAVAAIAFGPLMLALSSFFLIKGGLITVFGMLGALIARMKGAKGVTLFQSGSQRAAALQAKQMELQRDAEARATTRLATSMERLNASYAAMRTVGASASATSTRNTNTAVSNANRIASAMNTQSQAISRLTRTQQQAARNGGLVMDRRNMLNNVPESRQARAEARANNTNPAFGARLAAPVPAPAPVVAAPGIARQARLDAALYNRVRTAEQRAFVSSGSGNVAANPMRGMSEQQRRAAAGMSSAQPNNAGARAALVEERRIAQARIDGGRELARQDGLRAERLDRNNVRMTEANNLMRDQVSRIGGAAVGLGFIGSLLAGNNKLMQTFVTALMVAGTLAMVMPGLFAKVGIAIKGAIFVLGSAMPAMTGMLTGVGAALSAAMWPLLAIAAAGAAAYGIYRLVTTDQRKAQEAQEKINKSTEGWSKMLGYTRTQFGQVKNSAGEVVDTMKSMTKEALNDENLRPLIDSLKDKADDLDFVRRTLEREAVKMFADGANAQEVKTAIEVMLNAANINPKVKKQMIIEFSNVTATGLDGTDLSATLAKQVDDLFGSRANNTVSMGQQIMAGIGFGPANGDNNQLSQQAKGMLASTMNEMLNELQSADPKQTGQIIQAYTDRIKKNMVTSLSKLSPEVNKEIEAKGGLLNVDINSLKGVDNKTKDLLTYQQNIIREWLNNMKSEFGNSSDMLAPLFDDVSSSMVAMASNTASQVMNYDQAMNSFNSTIARMGPAWEKLNDEEKLRVINMFRSAAGLADMNVEQMKAALGAKNLGDRTVKSAEEIAAMTGQAVDANGELEELTETLAGGKVGNWEAIVKITMDDGTQIDKTVQDVVDQRKQVMTNAWNDVLDEMDAQAQIQFDAQKRAFKDMQQAASDALSERYDLEKKAQSKADEAEKKQFDKDWTNKIEAETKAYDDRVKAIEDQQKVEDDLETQRKRNADRESRRLKYLQSLMQIGIDTNIAMAGGDLDEVARLSLNAAQTSTDYNTESVAAEEGYKKEDEDKARSKAIELINEEKDARLKSLEEQKQMEQEAMEERITMRNEELSAKQAAEQKYLQRKQEDENIAFEISFAANQRALNRELEALRTQIPLNEAELAAHMGRVQGAYNDHGVQLMTKGDFWAKTIEDSLINRTRQATAEMSNDVMWNEFGNRVAEGISRGAFNMSGAEFNNFLRTGEMPGDGGGGGGGVSTPQNSNAGQRGNGSFTRHAGGPVGSGYDKYNNRAGIPKNAPMRSDETNVLAQQGEFMIRRKAHETYGTETMKAVNDGRAVIIRHAGGPIGNGLAGIGGGIQAAMMGALVSRAALAAGQAMMQAKTYGGSGMGGGPDIDVGGAGGGYGLRNGANISYGGAGFPGWVYSLASAKGVQASTYPGHQEGDRNEPGYAPNPGRLNRGIDWSGSVPAMQGFAEYLLGIAPRTPTLEQIIWMNPNTGQKIGWHGRQRDDGSYFASDYSGHQDHVHTRSNGPIQPGEGAASGGGSVAPVASDDIKAKFPQYSNWTTKGIDKYRDNAMAKFAPVYSYGGAGQDIEKGTYNGPVVDAVKAAVKPRGWDTGRQWDALYQLIAHESSWDPTASAWPASDAYGLFQFLSTTWATVGGQKTSDPYQQAVYGARYIGSPTSPAANNGFSQDPVGAWAFWNSHYPNWYDDGGIANGIGPMMKNTLKPERVLSPRQTTAFENLIPMLSGMSNMGIVGFDPILTALHSDNIALQNAVTAPRSSESNVEINVTIKDATIIGVDDLDNRLKEWSKTILQQVKQDQIDKERRLGTR